LIPVRFLPGTFSFFFHSLKLVKKNFFENEKEEKEEFHF
jgi:hypothetical protein